MLNTFVIDLGYVESSRLARFTFSHDEGFETVLDGLKSIRSALVEIVKVQRPSKKFSACCLKAKGKDNFCPKCGTNLLQSQEPGEEEYYYRCAEIFDNMLGMDIDSASDQYIWDKFEEAGWNLCGEDPGKNDPSRVYVCHVYAWIEEEDHFLEWYIQDKSYSNRT